MNSNQSASSKRLLSASHQSGYGATLSVQHSPSQENLAPPITAASIAALAAVTRSQRNIENDDYRLTSKGFLGILGDLLISTGGNIFVINIAMYVLEVFFKITDTQLRLAISILGLVGPIIVNADICHEVISSVFSKSHHHHDTPRVRTTKQKLSLAALIVITAFTGILYTIFSIKEDKEFYERRNAQSPSPFPQWLVMSTIVVLSLLTAATESSEVAQGGHELKHVPASLQFMVRNLVLPQKFNPYERQLPRNLMALEQEEAEEHGRTVSAINSIDMALYRLFFANLSTETQSLNPTGFRELGKLYAEFCQTTKDTIPADLVSRYFLYGIGLGRFPKKDNITPEHDTAAQLFLSYQAIFLRYGSAKAHFYNNNYFIQAAKMAGANTVSLITWTGLVMVEMVYALTCLLLKLSGTADENIPKETAAWYERPWDNASSVIAAGVGLMVLVALMGLSIRENGLLFRKNEYNMRSLHAQVYPMLSQYILPAIALLFSVLNTVSIFSVYVTARLVKGNYDNADFKTDPVAVAGLAIGVLGFVGTSLLFGSKLHGILEKILRWWFVRAVDAVQFHADERAYFELFDEIDRMSKELKHEDLTQEMTGSASATLTTCLIGETNRQYKRYGKGARVAPDEPTVLPEPAESLEALKNSRRTYSLTTP